MPSCWPPWRGLFLNPSKEHVTMSTAAFPWFGGKAAPKIRNAILDILPPHTRYIEPFGGGA